MQVSNRLVIAGMLFLAVSMTAVVFVLTDFMFRGSGFFVTGVAGLLFAYFWFGLPLYRRAKHGGRKQDAK